MDFTSFAASLASISPKQVPSAMDRKDPGNSTKELERKARELYRSVLLCVGSAQLVNS